MEPTKPRWPGRRPKDRSKHMDEAWALWSQKPTWSAHRIAERVAGEDAGLRTYLRKQLAAADRQACLEEGRRLRREKPILSDAEIIQIVKAMHHPRRQKLRIESDLVAELARMAPLEPRRRAEVAQPAARPAVPRWPRRSSSTARTAAGRPFGY